MADIQLHHFSLENKVSIHCRNSTLKPFHLRQLCDGWCNVTYVVVDVFVHGSLFALISMATSTSREDCFNTKSQLLQLILGEPLSTGEVYPSYLTLIYMYRYLHGQSAYLFGGDKVFLIWYDGLVFQL